MDLLQFTASSGKDYSFQAMVFDTGQYIRHGKWEPDHWTFFGDSKSFKETFTGTWHAEFNNARPKKNPDEVKKLQDENAKKDADAKAANDKIAADKAAADKVGGLRSWDMHLF